jgi:hypothetical protein
MNGLPQIEIQKEFSEKLVIHKNLGQEVIVTTVDKVRLCLIKNKELISAKKEWLTPLAIFLTLLTTLVAADFREFIFKSEVWYAIYLIGAVLSLAWLVCSSYNAIINWRKGSIDSIVEEFKAKTFQSNEEIQRELHVINKSTSIKFVIESAVYGYQNNLSDVTKILKSRIQNGKLNINVCNDIFGDPAYGRPKQLNIKYVYNGNKIERKFKEGEDIILP